MIQFNGALTLLTATPKTISELVIAAIHARTYASTQARTEAESRMRPCIIREGFIRPSGADVSMIDAYKHVTNGVAAAAGSWTLPDDFADGEILQDGVSRHFNNGVDLGARVLHQATGGNVTIYADITIL